MYDRARIFQFFASLQQSSESFDNVRLAFGTTLENLRKSSESGRKIVKNVVIRLLVCLYNKNITC